MKFLKRPAVVLALVLIVGVSALVLAGCGSTTKESSSTPEGIQEKSLEQLPEVVNSAKQQAGAAARSANLQMINTAIDMYYATNGTYPTDIGQLVPNYLKFAPVDPLGGTYYLTNEGGAIRAAVR
jgi:PBP1b-binding outer membrane lipoprotein LpoB